MGVLKTTVGVVAGSAVTVAGLYWLFKTFFDSEGGSGFGWGIGGSGKGEKLFEKGGAGVADEPGGTGGDNASPGGSGGVGAGSTQGGGGGTKPTNNPGSGGDGGSGGSGKDGSGKGGSGGSGGGIGGGSGGGIGSGEGEGSGGDFGDGGQGQDDGGGDDDDSKPSYEGLGTVLITADLPPPQLTKDKLDDLHDEIVDLVADNVWETELAPPLDQFDPDLGSILKFWADVALHRHFDLPPGKLDPDNPTHKPWIELWVDLFLLAVVTEEELIKSWDKEPLESSVGGHGDGTAYGKGARSRRFLDLETWAARRLPARSPLDGILGF